MNVDPPILQAENLSRTVGSRTDTKTVVDGFSYSFRPGRVYTIMGPSGAGKTSLLRLFNRLDEPSDGQVIFDSKDYREYDPCALRRRIGYLFQQPYLFEYTVADNLLFARADMTECQIARCLEMVSIRPEMGRQNADQLSIGEKQRVALARLLCMEPSVILLDEPTSALDPTYTNQIEKIIKHIAVEQNLAVLMVSHQPQQALRMGGEGLLLVEGRLVEHGPVEELVERPSTELGRRYRDRELT